MPRADHAARALVEYDSDVARRVLELILGELGGQLDGSPPGADAVTTSEWKESLASYERLRSLGRELERLLR